MFGVGAFWTVRWLIREVPRTFEHSFGIFGYIVFFLIIVIAAITGFLFSAGTVFCLWSAFRSLFRDEP